MPVFCSSCGKPLDINATFCASCGRKVSGRYASSPIAPTVTAAPLSDNVAGMLSYLLIPAIMFLVIEPYKRRAFVRFHAFQCIFLCIACFAINVILGFLFLGFMPMVYWFLRPLIGVAEFALWIVLSLKAYQGQLFRLPIVGDWATKQAEGASIA